MLADQFDRWRTAPERAGILNIGGFSDALFNVVASYLGDDAGRSVAEVESIEL
jgi:60 kDa SS-A/Ro ribonucleoprotein